MRSASIVLCALLVAPVASAEIFKCAGKDGIDRYQNFPCQFDSMGWLPQDGQGAKPSSTASDATKAVPKIVPPTSANASKVRAAAAGEPGVGMTPDEVKALWGEPPRVYYDELVDGRVEVWTYGESRSVMFDLTGHVSAVQR